MAVKSARIQLSVAAGASNVQALAGNDLEFLTKPSLVSYYIGQSATGLTLNIKADTNTILAGASPNVVAAAGRLIDPDDRVIDGVVLPAGTRNKIEVSNPTGGALTLSALVVVDELVL